MDSLGLSLVAFVSVITKLSAMTPTNSKFDQNTLPPPSSICETDNPCRNGGECHILDDWECSGGDEVDTIHYRCVCQPGYTGLRCEVKLNGTVCGPQNILCTANETCTHTFGGDYKCLQPGDHGDAPRCHDDIKTIKHRYNPSYPAWPIVCLEMMDTNSSWCYDPDDSLTFNITSQQVPHLFCLYVDFQKQQTCLRVNSTFVNRMVYESAWVQLKATENDYGKVRSDTLRMEVIFNTSPVVKSRSLTVKVNTAEFKGGGVAIVNAGEMASVSDTDGVTYAVEGLLPANTLVSVQIQNETGAIIISGSSSLGLQEHRLTVVIKASDKGVPVLSTSIRVDITLIYLECSTPPILFVDWTKLTKSKVVAGKMKCKTTSNYKLLFAIVSILGETNTNIEMDVVNGLLSVNNGNMGVYQVNVSATLADEVSVVNAVRITLSQFLTVTFTRPDLWNSTVYNNNTSHEYQKEIVYTGGQVESVLTGLQSTSSKVLQIRPGSIIVDVLLWSANTSELFEAKDRLRAALVNGKVGNMTVMTTGFNFFDRIGYLSITKSLVLTNGKSKVQSVAQDSLAQVACTAIFVAPVGEVTVEWRMTSQLAPVKPLPSSRIQKNMTFSFGAFTSTLTSKPILYRDKGPIMCIVKDEAGTEANRSGILNVFTKPVVTLTSLTSTSVTLGETISLLCKVIEPDESNTRILLYKNNILESNQSSTLMSTFKVPVSKQTNYSCKAQNDAGTGESNTVILNVVSEDIPLCGRDTDSRLTDWSVTPAGKITTKTCPEGFKGVVERKCGVNGEWGESDYSQCVRNELLAAIDDIQWLEDGVQVKSPEHVVNTLVSITTTEKIKLVPKEVSLVTSSLKRLVNVSRERKVYESEQEIDTLTKGFIKAASGLMDQNQVENWQKLRKQGTDSPFQVLSFVDDVGQLASKSLVAGEKQMYQSQNIVLLTAKTDPFNLTNIEFKDDKSSSATLTSSVVMKKGSLELISGTSRASVRISIIYYKNISDILPDNLGRTGVDNTSTSEIDINSDVVAFNMFPPPTVQLQPPLSLTFHHNNKNYNTSSAVCSYWSFETRSWRTDGCFLNTSLSGKDESVCSCNHLTNFALLMSPYQTVDHEILSTITMVGCIISVVCLVATIAVYIFVWRKLVTHQAVLVMNLCVALVIAIVTFLAGVDKTGNKTGCTVVAVLLHYLYLVVFFVMLAEGINVLLLVIKRFASRSRTRELLIMAWGLPLIIVAISMGATQMQGYGNDKFCWLSIEDGLLWAFVVPALVVIVVNICVIVTVVHSLLTSRFMGQKDSIHKLRASLRSICVLLPVMGVTWYFGVLSVNEDLVVFQYIFTVLNSTQGIFIFLFHCVFNHKVREALANKRRRYRSKNQDTGAKASTSRENKRSREDVGLRDRMLESPEERQGYNPLFPTDKAHGDIISEPDSSHFENSLNVGRGLKRKDQVQAMQHSSFLPIHDSIQKENYHEAKEESVLEIEHANM